jgi:hypothetical protein
MNITAKIGKINKFSNKNSKKYQIKAKRMKKS